MTFLKIKLPPMSRRNSAAPPSPRARYGSVWSQEAETRPLGVSRQKLVAQERLPRWSWPVCRFSAATGGQSPHHLLACREISDDWSRPGPLTISLLLRCKKSLSQFDMVWYAADSGDLSLSWQTMTNLALVKCSRVFSTILLVVDSQRISVSIPGPLETLVELDSVELLRILAGEVGGQVEFCSES